MLDRGEPLRIVGLARDLVRLSSHSDNDIQIAYTGLRPGEKLFEEIRLEGESVHPTAHPQIVVTEAPQPDSTKISHWLHRALTGNTYDDGEVRRLIRDLVCEYQVVAAPELPAATLNAKAALA